MSRFLTDVYAKQSLFLKICCTDHKQLVIWDVRLFGLAEIVRSLKRIF